MIDLRAWGRLPGGEPVTLATLSDGEGLEVRVASYGATLTAIRTPDRDGRVEDVLLGFDRLESCLDPALQAGWPYFGSTIGRTANRIAGARFAIDGREHRLTANEGANQNHGGRRGFDRRLWTMEALDDASGVRLRYRSPDGEEGFPGTLDVEAEMRIERPGTLLIAYRATTDAATHVSLASHGYFNLAGRAARTIGDHRLSIAASRFLPIDTAALPTGEQRPVTGTPFDLRDATLLSDVLARDDEQLRIGDGLNHCFALDAGAAPAARLVHEPSGRAMELRTTAPGLQVYSANAFDGSLHDEAGRPFVRRQAVALEAQHFPDSPNRPDFPPTLLRSGEVYRSETRLRFLTL
ncbi:MAG: aldose epimerase family protein [Sphingomonas oligoaromativorans]